MQEINLLQTQVRDRSNAGYNHSLFFLSLISVIFGLLILAGLVLFFLDKSIDKQIVSITEENTQLQNQIDSKASELKSATTFQAQLTNLKTLLNKHIYGSIFFNDINKYTYQKARYMTLAETTAGNMHLEGHVNTYEDLSKLLLGLETSKDFDSVKLLSVVPSSSKDYAYLFSIDLSMNPILFNKK